jgi:hypothetical protein
MDRMPRTDRESMPGAVFRYLFLDSPSIPYTGDPRP